MVDHDYDYDMIVLMKLSGWSEDGGEMCGCKSADEDNADNDDNDYDDIENDDEIVRMDGDEMCGCKSAHLIGNPPPRDM